MIEKWGIPVTPVTGKKPRTVYVYLPQAALEDELKGEEWQAKGVMA